MIQGLTLATSELWCIAPGHAAGVYRAAPERPERRQPGSTYALVEMIGTLTKPRMVEMRDRISALAANDSIGEILILVDSPGGTVSGTHDLHSIIARAAKRKRVTAIVEDTACSGALYAISGATEIVIGETALTGSIGVFNVIIDESKMLEKIGVEVLVIRSGEHKGAGVSGAKLTPDQITELKRRVDVQARHFIAAIARGRHMSTDKAAELADGRVFVGREAIAAGLADRIGMFEDVLAEAGERTIGLMYSDLQGSAAVEKFNELVAAESSKRMRPEAECTDSIRYRYPNLATAVQRHQMRNKEQLREPQVSSRPLNPHWQPH